MTTATANTEILEHKAPPSLTSVPDLLRSWAASNGMRLSWQNRVPEHLSMCVGQGITPVTRQDLEKADGPEGKSLLECLEENRTSSLYWTAEGYVQRFDDVLCIQPEAEHQHWLEIHDRARKQREAMQGSAESLAEGIEEMLRQAGSTGPVITNVQSPTAAEQTLNRKLKEPINFGANDQSE